MKKSVFETKLTLEVVCPNCYAKLKANMFSVNPEAWKITETCGDICPNCNILMEYVNTIEEGNSRFYRVYECPKCKTEQLEEAYPDKSSE